ncbi:hypothetical protein F4826_002594 [Rahnella inusitata]|nr:hypothetical protein [Rahnella inusitata]
MLQGAPPENRLSAGNCLFTSGPHHRPLGEGKKKPPAVAGGFGQSVNSDCYQKA